MVLGSLVCDLRQHDAQRQPHLHESVSVLLRRCMLRIDLNDGITEHLLS